MVKVQFFPLDVNYRVVNDKAIVSLFGRTLDGKQICAVDDSFMPYFYVLAKDVNVVSAKLSNIRVEREDKVSSVVKTEVVDKKFLSKEVKAIKVYVKLPRDVPVIRDVIKDWEIIESIHEYDILFTRKYLVDNGIVLSTLVEFSGEEINEKSKVQVFKVDSISTIEGESLKDLRVLAFDIETYNPDGKGINSEKNPILMVALYGDGFKRVVTWKDVSGDDIEVVSDEGALLNRFKELVAEYKPDVITGYYSDGFDFPYLKARGVKNRVKLDLGLDFSEMIVKGEKVKVVGITHIDVFKLIVKTMKGTLETDSYSLDNVAFELLGEKKDSVDLDKLADVWDNDVSGLGEYCKYNLQDAKLTYDLCKKLLPTLLELVKIVGLSMHDVNRMGFSQLVEGYLLKQAYDFNEIAPNKPHYTEIGKRRMQTYKGGFVFEPKPGLYDNIVIFDYRSLYPSIISSHNISPGTLNCSCCSGDEVPGEKFRFCKKVKGFVPTLIGELITRRMRIKEIIKKKDDNFLRARDTVLKLLANSFYGYLGFFGARWYSLECAKSVTSYGRAYIQDVISKATESGFEVLYSDTDSVFLSLNDKTEDDALKFIDRVNVKLPGLMEMEYEGFYPCGLFVSAKDSGSGAKKKYALITSEGKLKIKGFEAVRRNWSVIAKEVQEKVLRLVLASKDSAAALKYVKEVVNDLRKGEVEIDKLIIKTQLQKEIGSYDSVGPHVAVAIRMKEKGEEVAVGSVISYVVGSGAGRIRDKAVLPSDAKDYDADYYINNQVVPSVEKILDVFGYSKEDILAGKGQKKLDGFFKS